MNEFTPLSDIKFEEEYYLFGNDIVIKILDGNEYVFDKMIEEYLSSNLIIKYKEKNIFPQKISKEKAKEIISTIKYKNDFSKKELDFNYIEDLISGKKSLIVTNDETKKSFEITEITNKSNKKFFIFIMAIILLFSLANIFTISKLLSNNNNEINSIEKIDKLTLKNIVIIKNTTLPNTYDNYIEEKITNDMVRKISLDTSNVRIDTVGMYTYTIKYDDKEYVGVVIVVNNEQEKNQTIDQLENPEKYTK